MSTEKGMPDRIKAYLFAANGARVWWPEDQTTTAPHGATEYHNATLCSERMARLREAVAGLRSEFTDEHERWDRGWLEAVRRVLVILPRTGSGRGAYLVSKRRIVQFECVRLNDPTRAFVMIALSDDGQMFEYDPDEKAWLPFAYLPDAPDDEKEF